MAALLHRPDFPTAAHVAESVRLLPNVGERMAYPPRGAALAKTHELFGSSRRDLAFREGPQWRIEVAPGLVAVRSRDLARSERSIQRAIERRRISADLLAARMMLAGPWCRHRCEHDSCWYLRISQEGPDARPRGKVLTWSAKSRSNLRRKMSSLDYSVLPDRASAMVTLTLPGEWEHLVPDAGKGIALLKALRLRYQRAWGEPLLAVWKREFQRRGAPHWHLFMVPPHGAGPRGAGFREWLSWTWATLVDAARCQQCATGSTCRGEATAEPCEWRKHLDAGTGVDFREGARSSDPRRLATYFAKHGLYGAKEYQNEAPAHWQDSDAGIGRFWGVWGIPEAVSAAHVQPAQADAARRLLRRWQASKGRVARQTVWRSSHDIHPCTGEVLSARWYRRSVTRRVRLLGGSAGFLVVNDGPAMAAMVARHLADLDPHRTRKHGTPAVRGFLP